MDKCMNTETDEMIDVLRCVRQSLRENPFGGMHYCFKPSRGHIQPW